MKNTNARYKIAVLLTSAVLVLYYAIGFYGLQKAETRNIFSQSIPVTLIGTMALVFAFDRTTQRTTMVWWFLLIYVVTMAMEEISVRTGMPFGSYTYGTTLGPMFINVPLIIGLNWVFLFYTSAATCSLFRCAPLVTVSGSTTLMVVYDCVLERVAPHLTMWHWMDSTVPLQNYVTWALVGLFFHSLRLFFRFEVRNLLAPVIFLLQSIFFFLLAFTIK